MSNTSNMNHRQKDRYSGGVWTKLQEEAKTIQQEHDRGGQSEADLHRLADQLHQILGGVKVATELIPLVVAQHQKAVEWGLERLLVAARHLEALPYVEAQERQGIDQRITTIIRLVDSGSLDEAEAQVREIETQVEQLRTASLETEFATLLTGIGEMYQAPVQ